MSKSFCLIFLFFLTSIASAEKEPNWVLHPKEKWAIKSGIQGRQVYLSIPESSSFNNSELRYDAAKKQSFFVGLEKNGLGGSIAVESLFGNSSDPGYSDLRFYKHESQWSAEVSYLKYRGYKLTSSSISNPSVATSDRKDISFESYRVGGMWNFFPEKLALPILFQGGGVQKKSAGTVFLTGALSVSKLESVRGYIPYANDSFPCCQYKNDLDILSGALGVMGIYNFVLWERWLAGFGYGFEFGSQRLKQEINRDEAWQSFANNRYMLNFGFQEDDYFALIYFLETTQQVNLSQVGKARLGVMETNFILGYRFN